MEKYSFERYFRQESKLFCFISAQKCLILLGSFIVIVLVHFLVLYLYPYLIPSSLF